MAKALTVHCQRLDVLVIQRAAAQVRGIKMFHIKICYYVCGDYIKFRLRTKNFTKQAMIKGGTPIWLNSIGVYSQIRYILKRPCNQIIRDELHRKHGKSWRKYEQPKMFLASYNSAMNRMQVKVRLRTENFTKQAMI